jgi:hypothetical protein
MQNSSISTIFKKGQDGKYTNNALLYQYLLKYPILVMEQPSNSNVNGNLDVQVSLWDIMEWLITTLPEFKLRYSNDNVSKTIPKVRRRIKGKLDDLVRLELLLNEKLKQDKGDGTTDKYKFTIFGQLLGWIIYSIDFDNGSINATINRRETINKQIFNLLQQIFKTGEYSPTIDILASNFINNCMQRNLFGSIVNLLKNALNDEEIPINDVSDLLHNITTCNFREQNSKVIFTKLLDETIKGLEPKVKDIVLYNLKLSLERDIQNHINAYQTYERMWFNNKSDPNVVAVECSCTNTNCGYYTPVVIGLMEYKERKFYSKIDLKNLTPLCLGVYGIRSFSNDKPSELSAICKACDRGSLILSFPD